VIPLRGGCKPIPVSRIVWNCRMTKIGEIAQVSVWSERAVERCICFVAEPVDNSAWSLPSRPSADDEDRDGLVRPGSDLSPVQFRHHRLNGIGEARAGFDDQIGGVGHLVRVVDTGEGADFAR
jgi:hypothetical protein